MSPAHTSGHRPPTLFHSKLRTLRTAMQAKRSTTVTIAATGVIVTVLFLQWLSAGNAQGPKSEAVEDASGNLHVPDDYRTTYESLGSWALAADQGQGSKSLHIVYASPGTIAAYLR